MQLLCKQVDTSPYLTILSPPLAVFSDLSSSAASVSLRLHRNWFRSPFSMYSVIMHSGSVSTHTARRRTMLGSLRRDMIRISFRKSFLQHGEEGYQFNAPADDWWNHSRQLDGLHQLVVPGIFVCIFPQGLHGNQQRRLIIFPRAQVLLQKVLDALRLTQVHLF